MSDYAGVIIGRDPTWLWRRLCLWWRSGAARWVLGLQPSPSRARSPPGASTSPQRAASSVWDRSHEIKMTPWHFTQRGAHIHQVQAGAALGRLNVILRHERYASVQCHSARKNWKWCVINEGCLTLFCSHDHQQSINVKTCAQVLPLLSVFFSISTKFSMWQTTLEHVLYSLCQHRPWSRLNWEITASESFAETSSSLLVMENVTCCVSCCSAPLSVSLTG